MFNKITEKGNIDKRIVNSITGGLSMLNGLRDDLPVQSIDRLLRSFELRLIQEDGSDFEVILTGKEGRGRVLIADVSSDKPVNNRLVMSWYRYETTGRFDFNCYIS